MEQEKLVVREPHFTIEAVVHEDGSLTTTVVFDPAKWKHSFGVHGTQFCIDLPDGRQLKLFVE